MSLVAYEDELKFKYVGLPHLEKLLERLGEGDDVTIAPKLTREHLNVRNMDRQRVQSYFLSFKLYDFCSVSRYISVTSVLDMEGAKLMQCRFFLRFL